MNFPDKNALRRMAFWLGVAILFAAPLEVFHFLLDLLHTLFEWSEATLDFIIEVIFDTSLKATQVIVFYILIAAIFYGLYRVWRGFPDLYSQKKRQLRTFLSDEIAYLLSYWYESGINKIKLFVAASGLIFLLLI
ncbi:MAG: hypothetical protein Q7U23_11925 [Methylococcales bacterium]|nr:hypothetical protein [Methylococcales bacterium]